jgi:hypothetical protein
MAPAGVPKVYGPPDATPDPDFERRLFPISFSSQSSHFCSLSLTIPQSGAFGGLLPELKTVLLRYVHGMFCSTNSSTENCSGSHLGWRTREEDPVRSDATEGNPDVCPAKRTRVKASVQSSEVLDEQSEAAVSKRIYLRCSKRIHLELEYFSAKATVPVGHLCDWDPLRKCSYYAVGHHGCDPVGLLPACLGSADDSGRCQISSVTLWMT